jgi:hypothetical protein
LRLSFERFGVNRRCRPNAASGGLNACQKFVDRARRVIEAKGLISLSVSLFSGQAHNLKVVSSNLAPASKSSAINATNTPSPPKNGGPVCVPAPGE